MHHRHGVGELLRSGGIPVKPLLGESDTAGIDRPHPDGMFTGTPHRQLCRPAADVDDDVVERLTPLVRPRCQP